VQVLVANAQPEARKIAEQWVNALPLAGGKKLAFGPAKTAAGARMLVFTLNAAPNPQLGAEGYTLNVTPNRIELAANQPAGLFYAGQTLRQLLPPTAELKGNVPVATCKITDYPRFGWRGLMLDVSRHFMPKEDVKRYLDLMAQYKFNTLHWHLTDDNGWRIEIKALPKLTQVGAWRVARTGAFGNFAPPKEGEPTPYGGFYTQDDIREIVAYAQERHIQIVPEIDVPGHSMAALAAYPELSTQPQVKRYVDPGTRFAEWGPNGTFKMFIENTLNPADDRVYAFLDKVFTEVAALFPSPYLHMGGDEAYHGFWERDSACVALMRREGLQNSHELQSYFVKRVGKIIAQKGKTMIGWDEILEGGLAPGAVVMGWRGTQGAIAAAQQKHQVVMSPTTFAYLDYTQGDPTLEKPIYASLYLRRSYQFDPLPPNVEARYILGGQANLWTEHVRHLRHALYMTYPRAWAIAESVWSLPARKNWDDFARRTEAHFARFAAMGLPASRAVYDAVVTTRTEGGQLICQIDSELNGLTIHYTLDDSFPDAASPQYTGPFALPPEATLRVITYRNDQPLGRLLILSKEELQKRAGKQRPWD
jgi:hexosaminidase